MTKIDQANQLNQQLQPCVGSNSCVEFSTLIIHEGGVNDYRFSINELEREYLYPILMALFQYQQSSQNKDYFVQVINLSNRKKTFLGNEQDMINFITDLINLQIEDNKINIQTQNKINYASLGEGEYFQVIINL